MSEHIQFFVERSGAGVNWRLLAANHREAGRGASAFPDEDACRAALQDVRAAAGRLVPRTRRTAGGGWTWELLLDGQVVATSARPFDRAIRCRQVLRVVTDRLADAPLGRTVLDRSGRELRRTTHYRETA